MPHSHAVHVTGSGALLKGHDAHGSIAVVELCWVCGLFRCFLSCLFVQPELFSCLLSRCLNDH